MRVLPWMIVAAILAGTSVAADTFDLVTESEAATWNAAQPKEPKDFSTRDLREDNSAPTCHSSSSAAARWELAGETRSIRCRTSRNNTF